MIRSLLTRNWNVKGIAFLVAMVMWYFVNQSIIESKTIASVPVRIINIPQNKTIAGLLPTGYLNNRITLTLNGPQSLIEEIEPGDLEVLIDASTSDSEEWFVQVTKKNLISLDPGVDLRHQITHVGHPEFIVKFSELVTEKVPVIIRPPLGAPPDGYEFLDVWPQTLTQVLSGPKEEIQKLQSKGLKLAFNLDEIPKNELDLIATRDRLVALDEISYPVPEKWKQVAVPFRRHALEEINDSRAQNLRLEFLKHTLVPVEKEIPIQIFYPLKTIETINPETHTLAANEYVSEKHGIYYLTLPLYVRNVSRSFLDFVREHIQITVIAAPKNEREVMQWCTEVVKPQEMEDAYVASQISHFDGEAQSQQQEELLRKRFREYMRKLTLYVNPEKKLALHTTLEENGIKVEVRS